MFKRKLAGETPRVVIKALDSFIAGSLLCFINAGASGQAVTI